MPSNSLWSFPAKLPSKPASNSQNGEIHRFETIRRGQQEAQPAVGQPSGGAPGPEYGSDQMRF